MSNKERPVNLELEKNALLTSIAVEARERDLKGGSLAHKEFAVITEEAASNMLRWSNSLRRHIDFVVAYKEEDRIMYSVVRAIDKFTIEVFQPAIDTTSTIQMDQFKEGWNSTGNWLMMVHKER